MKTWQNTHAKWRGAESSWEGYKVAMKQATWNGIIKTICIDNFSMYPMSIHNHDCMTIEIDDEWINVFANPMIKFESYEDGLNWIKENMPNEYKAILKHCKKHDYLEVA